MEGARTGFLVVLGFGGGGKVASTSPSPSTEFEISPNGRFGDAARLFVSGFEGESMGPKSRARSPSGAENEARTLLGVRSVLSSTSFCGPEAGTRVGAGGLIAGLVVLLKS
jgi:hypothetical protein